MPRLTKRAAFFHTVRILLYYKVCRHIAFKFKSIGLGKMLKMPNLVAIVGLLCGTVVYHIVSQLFDWLLGKVFRLHQLGAYDRFFL